MAASNLMIWVGLAALFGLLIGSFLNVVIHRLPRMIERDWRQQCQELAGVEPEAPAEPFNLMLPRSACPHCGHAISAWENVPVVSYLWLRGKCASCRAKISGRYPMVELLSSVAAGGAVAHFGPSVLGLAAFGFLACLIALTFIDLDTFLLPDSLTLPLLWAGLLLNLKGGFVDLQSAVVGAAAGYLILWSVYWIFKLLTGKEGMGFGDFKLLAAIGAWFGWQMLPLTILASSAVGAVVGISQILLRGQGRDTPIPFGPYLAGAGVVVLFWGPELTSGYLSMLR